MRLALFAASLAAAAPAADAEAAPAPWKAGAASVEITPAEPIRLAGFSFRTRPSEGVRQALHVKALALRDATGKTAALVTADLAIVKRDVWDAVAERCRKQFGIERDGILLNESHSHSGPLVGMGAFPPPYELTPDQEAVVRRYTAGFVDKAVEAVGLALGRLAPAALAYGHGLAGIAVNRRRLPSFGPVPGGPVDHDVPVLSVRDSRGGLVAIVAGYACHATVFMDYQIGGDWPGCAQEQIEAAHPGAVALFVQGCGGDSFAFPRKSAELAAIYGRKLAAAVEQTLGSEMVPLSGPLRTAFACVDVPFQAPPSRQELEKGRDGPDRIARRHAALLLRQLDGAGRLPDRYPYPVQVWRFGHGLTLIALGGEVVVDYSRRLKAQYGWDTTWVAGYSNDTFAYIPSLRVLREGGYEGRDAMVFKGLPAPFAESVEETIVGEAGELVRRTSE